MGLSDPGTTSTTSSTASSDPKVKSTLDQLLGGAQAAYSAGPTYTAPGATTVAGQNASLAAAGNPGFTTGLNSAYGATDNLLNSGGLTAGQSGNLSDTNNLATLYGQMANDPGSTQAGKNLINDVTTSTNSAFNNSGLFGSDNNQTALSKGLTEGLGNLQQSYLGSQGSTLASAFGMGQQGTANQSALAQLLPTLYQSGQLPGGTQQAVGSAQDTSSQNAANKNLTLLSQLSGILQGTAPSAGTTTTATQPTQNPLLSLLGIAASAL